MCFATCCNNTATCCHPVFVCRTAHKHVGLMQDLYLPTNALAALANLAPQVSALW